MTQPFKFRYVNEIAGFFVLLFVGLFVAGVFVTGQTQGWFEKFRTLYISFPAEGSSGLTKGAEVQMFGLVAGSVQKIDFDRDGGSGRSMMKVELSVRDDFFQRVRVDSKAFIRKKFLVAGDAYVELVKGEAAPVKEGGKIDCELGKEIFDTIMEFADQVRDSRLISILEETSEEVRVAVLDVLNLSRVFLEEYTALANEFRHPDATVQKLLARVDRIAARLEAGEGTVGQLLTDSSLADRAVSVADLAVEIAGRSEKTLIEVEALLKDARKLMAGLPDMAELAETLEIVQAILKDIKKTTTHLPAMTEWAAREVQDAPGLVFQIRQQLREVEELVESVKKHWLIRGYVETTEPATRIRPAEVTPRKPVRDAAGGEEK